MNNYQMKYEALLLFFELLIIRSTGYYSVKLYGTIYEDGYYYINTFIGKPPQKQSLIIDTGSSQISFACKPCSSCGMHEYPPFNISKSTTGIRCVENKSISLVPCTYLKFFNEGSVISGEYFSDILIFENEVDNFGLLSTPLEIKYEYLGCNTMETNRISRQNASGIIGLALKDSFEKQKNAIYSLLYSIGRFLQKRVDNLVFSLCLLNNGGVINIGEYDEKIIETPDESKENKYNLIHWIPLVYPYNLYKVEMDEISIESRTFKNLHETKKFDAIIDLGSTFTYVPSSVYSQLEIEFSRLCKVSNKTKPAICVVVNGSFCWYEPERFSFPIIKIKFSGQKNIVNWVPNSYLYNRGNIWCTGIREQNPIKKYYILGISFFKNKQIILDPLRKKIGLNSKIISRCKGNILQK
ncbi:aspartyl protease ASP5 [Cryptosporidium felis]|nr:aspartyl protease ASP5 [Cryptosporidium felis]